jgi:sugar transferase (PEP-CTERM/EpsH1 system associated)
MRVLVVCHRFPYPPRRGGKIRPFNVVRHLAERHEVTVASLARTAEEAHEGVGLAKHCRDYLVEIVPFPADWLRMLARLPTATPSSMGYFYSPKLAVRVRSILAERRFDLIFVHCSSVAQYVEDVAGVPKILDFGDMDSAKWFAYAEARPFPLSLGYRLEGVKLRRAEMALARKFDLCTCTTQAELETLRGYAVPTPTDWFPNGVDVEYFAPAREAPDALALCFLGRMDYYPNQEAMLRFCGSILPQVRAAHPDVKLTIVGAEPSPAILRLGQLPGVTVTGTVPDVRPYVHGSAIAIAPLSIARGTQNKILEAMALGIPVVASAVAARGIDAVPGEHLAVARDDAEFVRATSELLADADARARLGRAARQRVESHHSWAASMRKFDAIVQNCLGRAGEDRKLTERGAAALAQVS